MTRCDTCGNDIDPDSAWDETMCVLCWEKECAAEWWIECASYWWDEKTAADEGGGA